MKVCQACRMQFGGPGWRCPHCGSHPAVIEGSVALAPELAVTSATGFAADEFAALASLEARNFWFRGRNRLIVWALTTHFPRAKSFLEIGCGTGYVLSGITQGIPELAVSGSEISVAGLGYAKQRNPAADLFQMDATRIPFVHEFDVIGAFDVLEHIEDDRCVLGEIFKAIKPGGGVVLTVPQHMFLWSGQDEIAGHFRRYGTNELTSKLVQVGFKVETKTSFVSLLLPVMAASRMGRSSTRAKAPSLELHLPRVLNAICEATVDAERLLIELGVRLPFGGSQLAIARKPK